MEDKFWGNLIGATVILIVIAIAVIFFRSLSCEAKGRSFENSEYGPIQGCLVKHKGRWLPLENIRGFD